MAIARDRPRLRPWRRAAALARRGPRLSIASYLGLGIGGLMFLAVGGVLVVTVYANWRNTTELLEDKSRLLLGSLIAHVERDLDIAADQADFISGLLETGELDGDDYRRLVDTMRAGIAASRLVHALALFRPNGEEVVVADEQGRIRGELRRWDDQDPAAGVLREAAARPDAAPYWAAPVFVDEVGTILNLRRPVRRDGRFLGVLVAAVRVAELSSFIAELETELGQNAFILYDRTYVLAHRALEFEFPGLSRERPLPRVTEVGDPVLFEIWRAGWQERDLFAGSGHHGRVAGSDYIYLYAPLSEYGDAPWLVGSYFAEEDIGAQFIRLIRAGLAGAGGLLLAVLAAYVFGRLLRRPIERLADAATAVRDLELEDVAALPRSPVRELDQAAAAFNAMVAALRSFSVYVPKRVVSRLIARGEAAALRSDAREVTVLFTDIAGFTARTQQLGAEETAAFLNDHFMLVTSCIEAEGGTVDKYIGDAVMALWGVFQPQPDQVERAVAAACAIAGALRQDNGQRREPVRVRMGLHRGTVVVGNIGTPTRMNYTVVGDPVNVAERLQELGRTLEPAREVTILLSGAVRAALPESAPVRPLGRHRLRGRDEPMDVFELVV